MRVGRIQILGLVVAVAAAGATMPLANADGISIEAPANPEEVEATGYFTEVDIGTATASSTEGIVSVTSNAPDKFRVGVTPVVWLATDTAGNRAVAVQSITVVDTTPPYFIDLPKYVMFETDSPKPAPIHFGMPPVGDLADIDVKVTSSHKSGQKFKVGNTTVEFTAVDASGNKAVAEIEVILKDTSPKIQNLDVKVNSPTRITVTWDPLDGHTSYKMTLVNMDTGKNIVNERSSSTTRSITGLDPDTDYTVKVSAASDDRTTVRSQFSTPPFAVITDDFSDLDGWTIKNYTNQGRLSIEFMHNTYTATIDTTEGQPAPSVKMHGKGYYAFAWLEKEFDAEQFGDGTIYLSIDYRSMSYSPHSSVTNAHIEILDENRKRLMRTDLVRGGTTDTGWRQHTATMDSLEGTDKIFFRMGLVDAWSGDYGKRNYYDNLYIGTAPQYDEPVFSGGSDDEPTKSLVDEILESITAGDYDLYQYEDGVKLDNEYNDLVDSLLRLNNVTAPEG